VIGGEMNGETMKRLIFLFVIAAAFLLSCQSYSIPGQSAAVSRVKEFANEINYHYKEPARIYPYLFSQLKSQISEEDFCMAFTKERSYPYLVPLFINYDSIEMAEDKKSGVAIFSQAARLPGMIYKVPFVYENGNYYMIAFTEFVNGEYLKKFERL
jgi:hypothetical protein